MPCLLASTSTRPILITSGHSPFLSPLPFLIPSLLNERQPCSFQKAKFSASEALFGRRKKKQINKRDLNRLRGVSPMRRTGLRHPLSVSKFPLPQPVLDPEKRLKPTTDENHGLWQFFRSVDKSISTPKEEFSHGRSWKLGDLQYKSWEDLHRLWWVCVKERNRIATESYERKRLKAGYGDYESQERDKTVQATQQAIKHALTERFHSWETAWRHMSSIEPQKLEQDNLDSA